MSLSRRSFLAASAAGLAAPRLAAAPAAEPVSFVLVGDTHYRADLANPAQLDARSRGTTARLVDTINKLPGTAIPAAAGGGTVPALKGVIHAGDMIDSGDKTGPNALAMQKTEWAAYVADYGLSGTDGRLKFPVYEVHGNHDGPRGEGPAVAGVIDRNKRRPGVSNVSANGLHYSWDWGRVHFVCLGIVVGEVKAVARKRRYAPLDSLAFLVADLKEKVGTSGRPVVITHHVDMLRYSGPADLDERTAASKEWDPADVHGYHDALKGYTVAAVLYGHTHARNVYKWDGSAKPAAAGVPAFNVDNAAHFLSRTQALFHFEIGADKLTVREYATTDAWETGAWTPQAWTVPL